MGREDKDTGARAIVAELSSQGLLGDETALDGMVQDSFGELASEANNGGYESQVRALLDAGWKPSDRSRKRTTTY